MASVFAMQPIGQIAGNLVSLVVVAICRRHGTENLTRTVDIMWRWVIGLGVIPGALALVFRFAIPETPRFLLDIDDDPIKAEFDATPLFGDIHSDGSFSINQDSAMEIGESSDSPLSARTVSMEEIVLPAPAVPGRSSVGTDTGASSVPWTVDTHAPPVTLNSPWKLSRKDIKQYFWVEGNWKTLFATAMTWVSLPQCIEKTILTSRSYCSILHSMVSVCHHHSFLRKPTAPSTSAPMASLRLGKHLSIPTAPSTINSWTLPSRPSWSSM